MPSHIGNEAQETLEGNRLRGPISARGKRHLQDSGMRSSRFRVPTWIAERCWGSSMAVPPSHYTSVCTTIILRVDLPRPSSRVVPPRHACTTMWATRVAGQAVVLAVADVALEGRAVEGRHAPAEDATVKDSAVNCAKHTKSMR